MACMHMHTFIHACMLEYIYIYTYIHIYKYACIIEDMHTYMHTLAYMHTCTSICMQAKPRCMNAHMHAFMYVATLYSWLCLCVLGHMYTAQPTYIHKEVFYPTQLHIPQGRGRGIIRWPITMEWGWGALARRICIYVLCTYIYVYIYICICLLMCWCQPDHEL